MRRDVRWAAVAAMALAGSAAAYLWWTEPGADRATVRLDPSDADLVALGNDVYATQCASCHGADLEGESNWRDRRADGTLPAPPHDDTGHTWHHSDALLFALTKYGPPKEIDGKPYRSTMPAFADVLSDSEIVAVLSFIKSRWPEDVAARQDVLNQQVAREWPRNPQYSLVDFPLQLS